MCDVEYVLCDGNQILHIECILHFIFNTKFPAPEAPPIFVYNNALAFSKFINAPLTNQSWAVLIFLLTDMS